MSLFGSSDDEASAAINASLKSRSLFDDEPPPALGSKSSLFADDDDDVVGTSPWGIPTPRKPGRAEVLRSLLRASDVPSSYIDIFDTVHQGGDGVGEKISSSGVKKVLDAGNLSEEDYTSIASIAFPDEQDELGDLGRNEFNVLLALIGLAQEHEDVTLDGVDERRRSLPIPNLKNLFPTSTSAVLPDLAELAAKPPQRPDSPPSPSPAAALISANRTSTMPPKSALDFPEADPWGSPALHEGHNHQAVAPKLNGRRPSNGVTASSRTTSVFTTGSVEGSNEQQTQVPASVTSPPVTGAWGSYEANSSMPFNNPPQNVVGVNGFGGDSGGDSRQQSSVNARTFGDGRANGGPEETIVITLLPEMEGMFLFQHHNYQVISARRSSKVVRRYSDFVWLLDYLHKRYPFRQLPLLPPKRVGLNGSHLAADSTFIEKRRRGLVRFSNALVRHPVLSEETLVKMFLTVPTELAVWRKQASISVQEEFVDRSLPPGLEDSLAPTLSNLFDTTRTGVRRSAEIYINLCNLMDRLAKRNEGLAADHLRISLSLQSLTDISQDTYATDTNDVPLLNEGLQATAKHMSNSQSLLEDEARAWDQGVLEDLKRQRDALVSMRDMFDRRDRYDTNNIPYLERRIQTNENKLVAIRTKPENLVKPGEVERVTEAILKDKESIVNQHARGVFIKECIRDELVTFQQSQFHVSRWSQEWAQERVKYSELQADNWKQLNEELESMPIGD